MSNLPQVKPDDAKPHIRFVPFEIKDTEKSEKMGRYFGKPVTKVFVRAAGDNKTEVPFIVDGDNGWLEQLKEKLHHNLITRDHFDYCIKMYNRWKEDGEIPTEGTPINGWGQINQAQEKIILNAHIRTVEELAEATEEAMDLIGMGARELKRKAQSYLTARDDAGIAAQKINSLEAENEAKDARLSELEKKLADLEKKESKGKK